MRAACVDLIAYQACVALASSNILSRDIRRRDQHHEKYNANHRTKIDVQLLVNPKAHHHEDGPASDCIEPNTFNDIDSWSSRLGSSPKAHRQPEPTSGFGHDASDNCDKAYE